MAWRAGLVWRKSRAIEGAHGMGASNDEADSTATRRKSGTTPNRQLEATRIGSPLRAQKAAAASSKVSAVS